jgi:membrane protein
MDRRRAGQGVSIRRQLPSYGETYGSLAGVAVLMLWMRITAVAALLGAELNAGAEAQAARDGSSSPRSLAAARGQ